MADDTTASQKQFADAKKDAYGDKPALDAKGEPLEKGVGSPYARLSLAGKAHLFAAEAYAAADAVVAAAKHLAEAGLKLAEHNKRAVDAAAACKAEPVATAAALSNDERAELEALRKADADRKAAYVPPLKTPAPQPVV